MARGVDFVGANFTFKAPEGRADVVDLRVFTNGDAIVSGWRLEEAELADVNRSGMVFLSVLSPILYPVFVGSEDVVRSVVADVGPVWRRDGAVTSCLPVNGMAHGAAGPASLHESLTALVGWGQGNASLLLEHGQEVGARASLAIVSNSVRIMLEMASALQAAARGDPGPARTCVASFSLRDMKIG